MGKNIIIKVFVYILVVIVSYNIVEPHSFGGYLLVVLVMGLISAGISVAFLGVMAVIALLYKLFAQD